jgi:putative proteasome-type protease
MDRGLVFISDTRTNSGIDNISRYRKMHTWTKTGDRSITLLSAGNLATTQIAVGLLDDRTQRLSERSPSILEAPTMFQVAQLVGQTLKSAVSNHGEQASAFDATLILGGQIGEMPPRLFLIYPEGNFIEAGADTPFLQIGEAKYGKPILVRAFDPSLSFEAAIKLLLVSFDSTMRANLSVGMPLDINVYEKDSLEAPRSMRVEQDDPYFQSISRGWSQALTSAVESLPDFEFPNESGSNTSGSNESGPNESGPNESDGASLDR